MNVYAFLYEYIEKLLRQPLVASPPPTLGQNRNPAKPCRQTQPILVWGGWGCPPAVPLACVFLPQQHWTVLPQLKSRLFEAALAGASHFLLCITFYYLGVFFGSHDICYISDIWYRYLGGLISEKCPETCWRFFLSARSGWATLRMVINEETLQSIFIQK